jgi:hypothetical protein
VPIVELLVEDKKKLILLNNRSNLLGLRPRRSLEILLCQFGKCVLVEIGDLIAISFLDHIAEVREELLDRVGDETGVATVLALILPVQSRIPSMTIIIVFILEK